ncbi:MAG: SLBB domain-containing protein [Elainella sp.]
MRVLVIRLVTVVLTIPTSALVVQATPRTEPSLGSPAAPSAGIMIDNSYALGAGDRLQITVFNVPEYGGEQQVLADGSLNLPVIGKLSVAGLTIAQAEAAIAARYQSELRYPRITVSLIQPRPLRIAISGEINQPGSYQLDVAQGSQFPGIAEAIQAAGGMTYAANLRQVEVRRLQPSGEMQSIAVDLWELLRNGDLRQNLSLRDGDMVFIPAATTTDLADSAQLAASNLVSNSENLDIAVVGEVFRPGVYNLTNASAGSGRPTVTKAIQQAGGIKPSADIRQIQVRRSTRNGSEQLITIDFWQLFRAGDLTQDLALQQGDTISIPTAQSASAAEAAQVVATNLSPEKILVNVVGEVKQPGTVQVPANTTLNQALLAAGGFTDRSRKVIELIRLNPDGTILQQQIEVDLAQGVNPQTNPLLWNNDVIVVDRTSTARLGDQLGNILGPLLQLLPLRVIF